jgi:hypothetical protein
MVQLSAGSISFVSHKKVKNEENQFEGKKVRNQRNETKVETRNHFYSIHTIIDSVRKIQQHGEESFCCPLFSL